MKLSNRLLTCAQLVRPESRAVDVGADHGHLAIYLLAEDICAHVIASDLREGPLSAAKRNAAEAGISQNMDFCLSDGLQNVPMEGVDTVICAGMGGDTIRSILDGAKAHWNPGIQWVLQPQADVPELRRYLYDHGFQILREVMARDGGFVYTIMEVRCGGGTPITLGESYLPQGQVDRSSPLYRAYMDRVRNGLQKTVAGIAQGKNPDFQRLKYFERALKELEELEAAYENGT